jgi:hypothetical protein
MSPWALADMIGWPSLSIEGAINDEVMHRVERDLDLEESRLEE